MSLLAHIADHVLNVPLALLPRKAATIVAVLGSRIGIDGDLGAFARSVPDPKMAMRTTSPISRADYVLTNSGIAFISIVGTLVNRGAFLEAESGLKSYDTIKRQMQTADADEKVVSIVLDLDTPGGEAAGCIECADLIHDVAQRRPVIAVVNAMACSAGYALAAAANQVVISPSGLCGSIGVVCIHTDVSRQMDARGITPTMIFAGAHKVDGNPLEPLDDSVRADIQADIDAIYDLLVDNIARHRPSLSQKAVRDTEARTFIGAQAIRSGLADKIGTLESVMSDLGKLHPAAQKSKYAMTERLYGSISATAERINDVHAAGVRAGMAAALAGKTS